MAVIYATYKYNRLLSVYFKFIIVHLITLNLPQLNWLSLKDGIPLRKTEIPLTENGKPKDENFALKDGNW